MFSFGEYAELVYTHSVILVIQAIWLVRYLGLWRYIHGARRWIIKQNKIAVVSWVFCQAKFHSKKSKHRRWINTSAFHEQYHRWPKRNMRVCMGRNEFQTYYIFKHKLLYYAWATCDNTWKCDGHQRQILCCLETQNASWRSATWRHQFGIFQNLRTGPTGHATLFNQWEGAFVFVKTQS